MAKAAVAKIQPIEEVKDKKGKKICDLFDRTKATLEEIFPGTRKGRDGKTLDDRKKDILGIADEMALRIMGGDNRLVGSLVSVAYDMMNYLDIDAALPTVTFLLSQHYDEDLFRRVGQKIQNRPVREQLEIYTGIYNRVTSRGHIVFSAINDKVRLIIAESPQGEQLGYYKFARLSLSNGMDMSGIGKHLDAKIKALDASLSVSPTEPQMREFGRWRAWMNDG